MAFAASQASAAAAVNWGPSGRNLSLLPHVPIGGFVHARQE
jgi:hypothetical protein